MPAMKARKQAVSRPSQSNAGFSLTEALVAASLSCIFAAAIQSTLISQQRLMTSNHNSIRNLLADDELTLVVNRIEADIHKARTVSLAPQQENAACDLQGRQPVLHLSLDDSEATVITYAVGDAPNPIWRSPVLMRCVSSRSGETGPQHVLIDGLLDPSSDADPTSVWMGCGALFRPAGTLPEPSTGYIDLNNSSRLGFSACKEAAAGNRAVGVRVILAKRNPSTEARYQIETLISGTP